MAQLDRTDTHPHTDGLLLHTLLTKDCIWRDVQHNHFTSSSCFIGRLCTPVGPTRYISDRSPMQRRGPLFCIYIAFVVCCAPLFWRGEGGGCPLLDRSITDDGTSRHLPTGRVLGVVLVDDDRP